MQKIDATRRQLLLLAILLLVSLSTAAVAIISLYHAAMDQQRIMLREVAVSQASLIDAVAAFDARWPSDFPGSSSDATLSQIRAANAAYKGFGDSGEFTLARRDGDQIVFMLSHRFGEANPEEPAMIPWRSELAEPMRRALSGDATTLVGLDYRGEPVLAATQPIVGTRWGLVAKIDLAEVQRPFLIAAAVSLVLVLILAGAGVWLFLRLTNPLLRELAEREARFRALFANAPNGIALVDQDGRPRISNPALQRFLGRTAEALAETPFTEFTHPDDVESDLGLYHRLWNGEIPSYQIEKRYLRNDGTAIWGLLTVALIQDERGTVLGAVGMVSDISEQRRMQQELTEAYERSVEIEKLSALGSFVGGVAHEVKNPLMGLINYIDYLNVHVTEPKLVDVLARARHQVERIDKIVDGILHYARGSAGQLVPTSIAKVVDAIAGLVQNPLATSNAQLTQCVPPDLPAPLTDPVVVEQALLNLVLNAIDAVSDHEQRRIEISAEQAGQAIELIVDDSGPGIPDALAARIFDPFFTTKPPGVGTGLGLSVTSRNLKLIGGGLTVTRGALGGARFVIRLPLEPPDALRQQGPPHDDELSRP